MNKLMFIFVALLPAVALATPEIIFDATTLAECQKQANAYAMKPENSSQNAMNMGVKLETDCVERIMNTNLDKRLLEIKKTDNRQFVIEMGLQKTFNASIRKFASFFATKCEGSVCGMCSPARDLFSYRATQAEQINLRKLDVAKIKVNNKALKITKKYFKNFAGGLCDMPKDVWTAKTVDSKCLNLALSEIAYQIQAFVRSEGSEGSEGDVCSQL